MHNMQTLKFSLRLILLAMFGVSNECIAISSLDDTFRPFVTSSILYDSNLLRMSKNIDPVAVTGKKSTSELMKQVAAGFDIDWIIGRQKIIIDTNFNQNWYQNFTGLDYFGWDNSVKWKWEVGNNLQGEVSYDNKEALGSFSQLNGLVANLYNNQKYLANGSYLFHPRGKVKFLVSRTDYIFDDSSRAAGNLIEDAGDFELQYLTATGGYYGLHIEVAKGQYPQRPFLSTSTLDNAYSRLSYEFNWDWRTVDRKVQIEGAAGYNQQNYAHLSLRDYGNTTGKLKFIWVISEKTLVDLTLKRQITQSSNINSSFIQLQGAYFNPKWMPTPKIDIVIPIYYYQQVYLGETGFNVPIPQQVNNTSGIGLNLTYKPLDYVNLGAVLNYEKRDSNIMSRAYETRSIGVNLQVLF
jgi:exopolysaccharide biosynthesis operon protein EpsL